MRVVSDGYLDLVPTAHKQLQGNVFFCRRLVLLAGSCSLGGRSLGGEVPFVDPDSRSRNTAAPPDHQMFFVGGQAVELCGP